VNTFFLGLVSIMNTLSVVAATSTESLPDVLSSATVQDSGEILNKIEEVTDSTILTTSAGNEVQDAGISAATVEEKAETAVGIEARETTVNGESTETAVNVQSTESAINVESTESAINVESTQPPVSVESTESAVNVESTESSVNTESPESAVNLESTESAVKVENTESAVAGDVTDSALVPDEETSKSTTQQRLPAIKLKITVEPQAKSGSGGTTYFIDR
jgi:hypothetical protein